MAKLIVTRPRIGAKWEARGRYQILIDGQRAGSLGPGEKAELELTPGHHQVRVGVAALRSMPVNIDAGPDETHCLAVGPGVRYQKLFSLFAILTALPVLGLTLWLTSQGRWSATTVLDSGIILFLIPTSVLPLLPQVALLMFWRHLIDLRKIPGPDLTDQQIAEFLKANPLRVRITIRQMMIAVAVVAVYLGVSIEWARRQRSDYFQNRASLHAELETIVRSSERQQAWMVADWQKRGQDASSYRQAAARAKARADYHAAMKRKYEDAAARRWFSVEPDPPEPPWP